MWGLFFRLSGGRLVCAELAVGSWLFGFIRRCQGIVGLGAEKRGWGEERKKAE